MKEYPVVTVTWVDMEHHTGWHDDESIQSLIDEPESEHYYSTSGHLIHKDKEKLLIASTVSPHDGISDIMRVPKSQVRSIVYLRTT